MAKLISQRALELVDDPYQAKLLIEYLTNPTRRKFIKIKPIVSNDKSESFEVYEVDANGVRLPSKKELEHA